MESFGAALLREDYFGAIKPVMAAPLKAPVPNVVRASVVRRAAARSFIRVKSNVMQAVRAGTMSADQARAVLNKAGRIVSATGRPVYVRSAQVQKTLSAAGPQAPGADPATALVKAPTLYTSRLSEEEEALLREDSPEIQEKFRLAIEKLKRGVSKRSRIMMGFDEFGYDPDEDDDYDDDFGADLLAEEAELWDESYVDQFGYDNITQWEYNKQHGGTRWGPRSMGGGYGTF
jgi:hypothetical protein